MRYNKSTFGVLTLTLTGLFSVLCLSCQAQESERQQILRGSITPERAWWDLTYYHLQVEVDPENKRIFGSNEVHYQVLEPGQLLQIDLQEPMSMDKVYQGEQLLSFTSEGSAHFIQLDDSAPVGSEQQLTILFSGKPRPAVRAPWDGGFSWERDSNRKPFIATSNQGIGASVWWPNKDHPADEVDSMKISLTVPKELVGVSNGRLVGIDSTATTRTFNWKVTNPINNYGVNLNIGDYVHWHDTYAGEQGTLDLDFWVLRENLAKAKEQFKQVPMMLNAFEHWFGPYPFYEDSYKLVEVPYLGMEHQSSVTYGNEYRNGYRGQDLSGTGEGLKFDFIIIHESGHEWFANNITNSDVADMWIHEGFTAYSENLYLDYHFGTQSAADYVIGTRGRISNDRPIIGTYGKNQRGSSDMYYKGANILHTLRQLVEDDEKWRKVLRGLNKTFYHQTVSSAQVEDYISQETGIDLTEFFDQYLRTTMIPSLEYKLDGKELAYRYVNVVKGFDMPVEVMINDQTQWLYPNAQWNTWKADKTIDTFEVDRDFYITSKKVD
ncbi:M1 family metallopeptidase [Croceiramulus getboli]|nr:M1 family metallopeptidase [Flavobacteriaceae bacterium YJPT1-3]